LTAGKPIVIISLYGTTFPNNETENVSMMLTQPTSKEVIEDTKFRKASEFLARKDSPNLTRR